MKLKNACIRTQHTFTISVKTGITGMKSALKTLYTNGRKIAFRAMRAMCVCMCVLLLFFCWFVCLFVRRLELLLSFTNKPIATAPEKPTSTVRKLCSIVDEIRENHKSSKMHKIYFLFLSGRKETQVILVVIFWSLQSLFFFYKTIHILPYFSSAFTISVAFLHRPFVFAKIFVHARCDIANDARLIGCFM